MNFLASLEKPAILQNSQSTSHQKNNVVNIDYKNCVCPRCNRYYDFQIQNGVLFGRVALILPCKHSVCEACVHNDLARKIVSCGECTFSIVLEENDRRKPQQLFYINFYNLGLMLANKPEALSSKFSLRPAGVNYSNRNRSDSVGSNYGPISPFILQSFISSSAYPQVNCSMIKCKSEANVKCVNCDDVFCNRCSAELHKSCKALMNHKIETLQPMTPEINKKCKDHNSYILDFFCNTCSVEACCYCIVQSHTGHDFRELTILESSKTPYFETLLQKAMNMLKVMNVSQKKIVDRLQNSQKKSFSSKLERDISTYFANLHANLQMVEIKLKIEAAKVASGGSGELMTMNETLTHNSVMLSNLIKVAKCAISPQTNTTNKVNVGLVTEKLEKALQLPCCFVENSAEFGEEAEFLVESDIFQNIQDSFKIVNSEKNKYKLVSLDETSADYSEGESSVFNSTSCKSDDDSIFSVSFSDLQRSFTDPYPPSTSADNEKNPSTEKPKQIFNSRKKEEVVVTHINSPESFFVQFCRNSKNLEKLTRDINIYVKNNFHFELRTILPNSLHLVRYDQKRRQEWCRGRILDRIDDDMYQVFFIDYGNVEPINRKVIMDISSQLSRLKPFAIECKLFNLFPTHDDWDTKSVALMAEILTGSDKNNIMITMNTNNTTVPEVDLLSVSGGGNTTSIREALLYMGYAITHCKSSSVEKKKNSPIKQRLFKRSLSFRQEEEIAVVVSHVTDESDVFVQFADFHHHIIELGQKLNTFYEKKHKNLMVYVPENDMAVAVKWDNGFKPTWYRAKVVETIMGQATVVVYLVDYGVTTNVNVSAVRKLVENFVPLECQAIQVRLADIEVVAIEKFMIILQQYITQQNKLKMVIKNVKNMEVVLFDIFPDHDLCINSRLVIERAANSTGPISETLQWIKEPVGNQEEDSFTTGLLKTIQGTDRSGASCTSTKSDSDAESAGLKKPVEILSVENPDIMFVALSDKKVRERQNNLHVALQSHYSPKSEVKDSWKINDVCVVYNMEDRGYFRGIIQEKVNDQVYKILLCDAGKLSSVDRKYMYVMEEIFKQFPERAVRCHMSGIKPAGDQNKWSHMAIDYLKELVENETGFMISKSGETDLTKKSLPITLWYQKLTVEGPLEPSKITFHSVNSALVSHGLALKTQRIKRKDPASNKENVEVSASESSAKDKSKVDERSTKNKSERNSKLKSNHNEIQYSKRKNVYSHKKERKQSATNESDSSDSTDDKTQRNSTPESTRSKKYKSNDDVSSTEIILSSQTSLSENSTPKFSMKNSQGSTNWNDLLEQEGIDKKLLVQSETIDILSNFKVSTNWNDLLEQEGIDKKLLVQSKTTDILSNLKEKDLPEMRKSDKSDTFSDSELEQKDLQETEISSDISTNAEENDLSEKEDATMKETSVPSVSSDWLPPIPLKKNKFEAIATFVDHSGNIYLHDVELEPILKEMEKEMKSVFDKCPNEPLDTPWFVNQMCTVQYFMNNSWYRGKIISITGETIKVRMVDYGNEEDCKHGDLRLKIMFEIIPAIASKVCLHNVFPKSEWITSDLDTLHALVVEKQLSVFLKGKRKKKGSMPAIIFANHENVNQFMLKISSNLTNQRSMKNSKDHVNKNIDQENDEDIIILTDNSHEDHITDIHNIGSPDVIEIKNDLNGTNLDERKEKKFIPVPLPSADDLVDAALISVIDYNRVVIEFTTDNDEDEFVHLSREIDEEGDDQPSAPTVKIGCACIAKFSEDNNWYRGQIYSMDRSEEGVVQVWFVDFGNFDYVSIDDVREIKEQWLDYPLQHFIAEIDDFKLPHTTEEEKIESIIDKLSEHVQTMKKVKIVSRNPLKIKIFHIDGLKDLVKEILTRTPGVQCD